MKKQVAKMSTFFVVFGVLILAIILINQKPKGTDEEVARCIGENSVLYSQLGCSHCIVQEEMFGENYQFLTVVDCYFDRQKCIDTNITGTPTWVIKNEKYVGVQEIEKLRELTGC